MWNCYRWSQTVEAKLLPSAKFEFCSGLSVAETQLTGLQVRYTKDWKLSYNCHYLTPILAGGKEEVDIFIFVGFFCCLPRRNRKELCTRSCRILLRQEG